MPMILNLLDRMKLPFRKNKELVTALHDILGFYPHQVEIYRTALSHRSISSRRQPNADGERRRKPRPENTTKPLHNERLEFLGDAVLESVVSDIVFHHFPYKREGFLTSTRAKIVQRESLNRLAKQMGIEKLILAAHGTRMSHTNIGGNAFEALMGAIYLDRGYKHCFWFITHRVLGPYLDLDGTAKKEVNFKSKLLEWSQKNRIGTTFKDSAVENKGFRTTITIEGIEMGSGNGRTKKESQQEASKNALMLMRKDPKLYDSLFRSKEKRTAMEADESFALPRIDEIEDMLGNTTRTKDSARRGERSGSPYRHGTGTPTPRNSDEAYDAAYDELADYEVIDSAHDEQPASQPDAADGKQATPTAEAATPRPRRNKGRGAKPYAETIKGHDYAAATLDTPEEESEKCDDDLPGTSTQPSAPAAKKPTDTSKKPAAARPTDKPTNKAKKETQKLPTSNKPAKRATPLAPQEEQVPDRPVTDGSHAPAAPAATQEAPNREPRLAAQQPAAPAGEQLVVVQDITPSLPKPEEATQESTAPRTTPAEATMTHTSAPQVPSEPALPHDDTTDQPMVKAVGNLSQADDNASPNPPERKVRGRKTEGTQTPITPTQPISRPTEAAEPHTQGDNGLIPPHSEIVEAPPREAQSATDHASFRPEAPLPLLRHLSLDEFVFGTDDTTPGTDFGTSDNEGEPEEPTSKSTRKPRRRNRNPRSAREQSVSADGEAASPEQTQDGEPETSPAPRHRKPRRRRKPGSASPTRENNDENGEKPTSHITETND